jgi:hypothetical protein
VFKKGFYRAAAIRRVRRRFWERIGHENGKSKQRVK